MPDLRRLSLVLAAGLLGSSALTAQSQQVPLTQESRKPLDLRPGLADAKSHAIVIEHLDDLARSLLHHAPDAGCQPGKCTILVTDFVFPDGETFPNGIWWADELSRLFARQENKLQVVDRILLAYYMRKERVPAKTAYEESSARWLGDKCEATVVLVGQARMVRSDVVELSARFLNVRDKNLIGPSSDVDLAVDAPGNLAPTDGLDPPSRLKPFPDIVNGEKVYAMGTPGMTLPSCYYMPNPPYTEKARSEKFSGRVAIEAAVGSDGVLRAIRIVEGAPFGLNEQVIKTLSTWKCKPAMLNGKPVATVVPFETSFRLY